MPEYPQEFGSYTLVEKIAQGGMAEIFLAKKEGAVGFERDIVIKRILPSFSEDPAFVTQFIDEAALTSKLQHAHIVQVFDFDVANGQYFIAMEYVRGKDLRQIMTDGANKNQPLSVMQAVKITIAVAKALGYAHAKQVNGKPLDIIHRDVTPQNIMVTYRGDVKLMDFGIAKAAERSTKTQAGMVKGKVAYMSPEQARGKELDGRSDLFALATVLWEVLTGERLFLRPTDFACLTAILREDPAPPSQYRQEVDPILDAIILKALAKDRDERFPNMTAFEEALTRWYYEHADPAKDNLASYMQSLYAGEKDVPQDAIQPQVTDASSVPPTVELNPNDATLIDDGSMQAFLQDVLKNSGKAQQLASPTLAPKAQTHPETAIIPTPSIDASGISWAPQMTDHSEDATVIDDGSFTRDDIEKALQAARAKKRQGEDALGSVADASTVLNHAHLPEASHSGEHLTGDVRNVQHATTKNSMLLPVLLILVAVMAVAALAYLLF